MTNSHKFAILYNIDERKKIVLGLTTQTNIPSRSAVKIYVTALKIF